MADDKKISALDLLNPAVASDLLVIVDTSLGVSNYVTKRIRIDDLYASPQPIGSVAPNSGNFTTLQLPSGATINEFSTDGTLVGDSNVAVPTEQAVKTYVDTAISTLSADRITDGDSSVVVADSTAGSTVTVTIDSTAVATYTTGGFTLASGATVNEFSTDGTLVGFSDTAVPTEQAVKTYVDTQIANLNPDKIWEGDSYVEVVDLDGTGSGGYVTMVADGVEVTRLSETTQRFGTAEDNITVTDGTASVPVGAIEVMSLDENGLQMQTGATVNEFSTDGTLADNSDTALPTEQAVKTYVDNKFAQAGNLIVSLVSSDTTALNNYALLVDTTAGNVNVVLESTGDSKIIIKKITDDSNVVNVTVTGGLVENSSSQTISEPLKAFTFIGDGTNYYIV